MADRSEILEYLRIVDFARHHPNLKNLHDHAMAQLVKANEEHTKKEPEEDKQETPAPRRLVARPEFPPRG